METMDTNLQSKVKPLFNQFLTVTLTSSSNALPLLSVGPSGVDIKYTPITKQAIGHSGQTALRCTFTTCSDMYTHTIFKLLSPPSPSLTIHALLSLWAYRPRCTPLIHTHTHTHWWIIHNIHCMLLEAGRDPHDRAHTSLPPGSPPHLLSPLTG